jgi:hypothetical protein
MSRLHRIPYGNGIILVPDWMNPVRDERVVRPARRGKAVRRG